MSKHTRNTAVSAVKSSRESILAELSHLRRQVESYRQQEDSKSQEVLFLTSQLQMTQNELQRLRNANEYTVNESLEAEIKRLMQENAMVLEYLDKSMDEIQQHKESNAVLLRLQSDQLLQQQELDQFLRSKETETHCLKSEIVCLHEKLKVAGERENLLKKIRLDSEESRQKLESELSQCKKEFSDLQAIHDELSDSMQHVQAELTSLKGHDVCPVNHFHNIIVQTLQKNTAAFEHQQQTVAATFQLLNAMIASQNFSFSNCGDNTLASSLIGPVKALPSNQLQEFAEVSSQTFSASFDKDSQCNFPEFDSNRFVSINEVNSLNSQLQTMQDQHSMACDIYETEIQHLRIQQETQIYQKAEKHCYESLQSSYNLSEARGKLLKSISLFSDFSLPSIAIECTT